MMKKWQWVLLVFSWVTLNSAGAQECVIRGEVTGFPDSTLIYLADNDHKLVDSVFVVDGHFLLKGTLAQQPSQLRLYARMGNRNVYTPLLVGNETIDLRGDIEDFPFYVQVSGSRYHDQQQMFMGQIRDYMIRRDLYLKEFFALPSQQQNAFEGEAIWAKIRPIDKTTDSLNRAYVFTHTNTYAALIQLGYMLYSLPKDSVQRLFDAMSEELRESLYAERVKLFLATKVVSPGELFADFEAEDSSGRKVRFSELVGQDGKYLLLQFTSAGCGPCFQAAKQMRQMVNTYSDSLSMVSFSVDSNRAHWEKALVRDSVSWLSLWEGKGVDRSPTCVSYAVRGVPAFYLIDPQGKIVQNWRGYGPDIFEEKIGRLKNK